MNGQGAGVCLIDALSEYSEGPEGVIQERYTCGNDIGEMLDQNHFPIT
jgi:hypothetical protein